MHARYTCILFIESVSFLKTRQTRLRTASCVHKSLEVPAASGAPAANHRIGKFREMIPETGPSIATEDSLTNDSRSTCTLPGAGLPSTILISESGTFGSSLSSHSIVGEGANNPTYTRSLLRSRFSSEIN